MTEDQLEQETLGWLADVGYTHQNGTQTPKKLATKEHSIKHTDWLKNKLKDDNFAAQYLTQAAQDLEPAVFIAALRHVVDARAGLARVADVGSLSKASLYKAIPHSGQGNPTARTMFAALRASGLNLMFSATSPAQ